jgi:hypothetical protein
MLKLQLLIVDQALSWTPLIFLHHEMLESASGILLYLIVHSTIISFDRMIESYFR